MQYFSKIFCDGPLLLQYLTKVYNQFCILSNGTVQVFDWSLSPTECRYLCPQNTAFIKASARILYYRYIKRTTFVVVNLNRLSFIKSYIRIRLTVTQWHVNRRKVYNKATISNL